MLQSLCVSGQFCRCTGGIGCDGPAWPPDWDMLVSWSVMLSVCEALIWTQGPTGSDVGKRQLDRRRPLIIDLTYTHFPGSWKQIYFYPASRWLVQPSPVPHPPTWSIFTPLPFFTPFFITVQVPLIWIINASTGQLFPSSVIDGATLGRHQRGLSWTVWSHQI